MLLNSIGVVYVYGVISQPIFPHMSSSTRRRSGKLSFPRSYPPTTHDHYESQTAIQQFSVGRSHVLGLADNGNVWFWCAEVGFLIQPVNVDLVENRVTKVVAGKITSFTSSADPLKI